MRSKRLAIFAMSAFIALMSVGVFSVDSNVSKEKIGSLFTLWNSSLQTGDPDKVARTYADDAVLLPTMSKKIRRGHEEIEDYFKNFLKLGPRGKIEEESIRVYGDIAINSGLYTFCIVKDGIPSHVKARYTFIYRKLGDKWQIVEHHSSFLPEEE